MTAKRFARKRLLLSFLAISLAALAACGTSDDSTGSSGGGNEVTIGYTGPLSGAAAYYGENTLNGLKMAVDEINEAGGFEVDGETYTLNLATLDDKYMPNDAAQNAKRLVQEENAKFIFIPHSGGVYASQVFNEQDDFMILAYSSEPGIVEQGNPLTVRIPPGYDGYVEPFSDYQMKRFGKRIAFITPATQYGKDWAEGLKPVWEEKGGEIVYEGTVDYSKDTDFYTIVTNALNKNPDVLFIGGPSEPTARVAKQARDLGFEGGFLVMDQAKLDEMAAVYDNDLSFLEGAAGVNPLVNADYPGTAPFIEKYNERYNKNPGSEAGYHYVALYGLIEAMKAAGTVDDPKAVMEAFDQGVKNIPEGKQVYTVAGVDEDGAFIPLWRMAVVENGEIKSLELDNE